MNFIPCKINHKSLANESLLFVPLPSQKKEFANVELKRYP